MRTDNRLLLATLALFIFTSAPAQKNSHFSAQKEFLKTVHNKFRANVSDYIEYHLEHPGAVRQEPQTRPLVQFRTEDLGIDNTPEAESELHAAINPIDQNNIIVAAMRNNPTNLLSPLTFPIYYTNDFGASWQTSTFNGVPAGSYLVGGGDPVLAFDSQGRAHMTWLTVTLELSTLSTRMALRYAYSGDGGATWEAGEQLLDEGDIDPINPINSTRLVDKEWLAVDRTDGPFKDQLYMVYVEMIPDTLENVDANMLVKTKPAGTNEFSEAVRVNHGVYTFVQYSSIAVDHLGNVHVFFMGISPEDGSTSFYTARSADGGKSFQPEVKISDFHLPGFSEDQPSNVVTGIDSARIYPCPHLRADYSAGPHAGNLYAVWTANGISEKASEGVDIYFTRSKDGGKSWAIPRVLNDNVDPISHQFYPSLHVNELGTIIATWYDRRDDPDNLQTHYYMTYSFDGGESFTENVAVSTAPTDFNSIGEKNGGFGIGEYTQVIATADYAIPVWSDGRSNDGNIDLFAAFIPIDSGPLGVEHVGNISPQFAVENPFPNPVKAEAILKLMLKEASTVTVDLHSIDGKLVRRLTPGSLAPGKHEFPLWVGNLPVGDYLVTVHTDYGFKSNKIVVSR